MDAFTEVSLPEKNNDALCALLREACIVGNNNKKFDQCIRVGDFNYKDINWNSLSTPSKDMEQKEDKFLETVKDTYLYQHVD